MAKERKVHDGILVARMNMVGVGLASRSHKSENSIALVDGGPLYHSFSTKKIQGW